MSLAPPTLADPAYFERLARAEAGHWWSLGMWRLASFWLDRTLKGCRGLRALDVGCGAGGTMRRLALRPEIAEVAGIDPASEALRLSGGAVILGSALDIPFPSSAFDLVTCLDVMQHLPVGEDRRAASEIRRVLRPGGIALLRANGRGLRPGRGGDRPPYALGELVAAVEAGGLRVEAATYANCLPAVAAELIGAIPRPGRERLAFGHPAGKGLRIDAAGPVRNRLMGLVSAAEAVAAGKLGWRLPVGHSTMILARAEGGDGA